MPNCAACNGYAPSQHLNAEGLCADCAANKENEVAAVASTKVDADKAAKEKVETLGVVTGEKATSKDKAKVAG